MGFEDVTSTEELFDLLADNVREMVREELTHGRTMADIVIIIADYDDRFATDFMGLLGLGPKEAGEERSDDERLIGCAVVKRSAIDDLVEYRPDLAGTLSVPLGDNEVLTIVISGGLTEVFHLFMEPRAEVVSGDAVSDVARKSDGLFESYKDRLADMALESMADGKHLHGMVGLIFDLRHPESREVVGSLMPDLDLDSIAPAGSTMVGCGIADIGVADLLASAASGLAEVVSQPAPAGSILTLVVAFGHITAYHLFMSVSDRPSGLPN